jgi:hypothetical protein
MYFDGIDPRVVSAEHGWWYPNDPGEEPSLHGLWRSNINAVVDDDLDDCCDPRSGAWTMREQLCKVYKDTFPISDGAHRQIPVVK